MSQPWMRKVAIKPNRDNRSNTRVSIAKAAEDPSLQTSRANHEVQRSRSKNKISKSVRYDLENALVGLCDLWFEEIKPHLMRKNIKLHVHGAGADRASGDYEEVPPAAPNCTHVDPGAASHPPQHTPASCANYCSTQTTVSKAPCPKPLTPPCRLHAPSQIPPIYDQNRRVNCEQAKVKRPRLRRKKHTSQSQVQLTWRVPRLCRTYSLIPSGVTRLPSPSPCNEHYHHSTYPHRRVPLKNKSTQTPPAKLRSVISVASQTTVSTHPQIRFPLPAPRPHSQPKVVKTLPPTQYHKFCRKPPASEEAALFHSDLIDIISETNDTRLRVIYNSPRQVEDFSSMNLVTSQFRMKKVDIKKKPPWR